MKQFSCSNGAQPRPHISSQVIDHPIKAEVIRDVQEPAHDTDVMTIIEELKIWIGDVK